MSRNEQAGQKSDTEAKTLALLRRLLVGNGYALEDIKLEPVEETDLHLPGRVVLELQVIPTETRAPGLPRGSEAAVCRTRDELAGYISRYHADLAQDTSWVDEIRNRLAKNPAGGWGMKQGDWELGKQTKRAALVLPCDICRGQKVENCRLCFGQREVNCQYCHATTMMACQTCQGSGANPQDRSQPCPQCQGRARVPCIHCHARGRLMCHQCRGTGQTPCIECQGHGFFVEETLLKASAQGRFETGSLAYSPKGVTHVLDTIGTDNIVRGHAVVTPVPAQAESGTSIEYDALLPYGRYNMRMKNDVHEIIAVGMKPILADFPPLLDDTLSGVPDELNAGTLTAMTKKYRIIRELAEALGRGEKPAKFFSQRYPFGLTPPLAFAIAGKLRQALSSISLRPRVTAAILLVLLSTGAYYGVLTMPRPALPVPAMAGDGLLAVLLATIGWLGVCLTGQTAIKRVMPMRAGLASSGGMAALVTALLILAGCAALLVWPETRPDWLDAFLK